ncbi:hypothetical protein PUN28_000724 [Cardiocondyla obscurior]|uniref:Uncharacterized protein n=1 Tax=Cardiocondyla obscurior TaxID=286306 RepID=A0AAW2H0T7_9HYME
MKNPDVVVSSASLVCPPRSEKSVHPRLPILGHCRNPQLGEEERRNDYDNINVMLFSRMALMNSITASLVMLFIFNKISRVYLLKRIITIVKLIVVKSKVFNEWRLRHSGDKLFFKKLASILFFSH